MDSARCGVDKFWQGIDIGGEEFADTTQLQDFVDQRVTVGKLYQNFLGGGILAAAGALGFTVDFQFLEQDLAHLHRRCGVELLAGKLEALLFNLVHLRGEPL